jgi:hypothetical protein
MGDADLENWTDPVKLPLPPPVLLAGLVLGTEIFLQDPKDAPACKISCNNVIVLAITVITSVNKMKIHLHPTLEDLK